MKSYTNNRKLYLHVNRRDPKTYLSSDNSAIKVTFFLGLKKLWKWLHNDED